MIDIFIIVIIISKLFDNLVVIIVGNIYLYFGWLVFWLKINIFCVFKGKIRLIVKINLWIIVVIIKFWYF